MLIREAMMTPDSTANAQQDTSRRARRHGIWLWIGLGAVLAAVGVVIAGYVVVRRAEPILKGRVITTLQDRFQSRVELDRFEVSVNHGLDASGGGLRIYSPHDEDGTDPAKPMIAIESFDFHANVAGLFVRPMHVGVVHVRGLDINLPPRQAGHTGVKRKYFGKSWLGVDAIICDDSQLVLGASRPDKDPRVFLLKHIVLHDVGPSTPWPYDATLTNAIPKGDIHAVGRFGPWNTDSPGDSDVKGDFTFDHADLNTIKGLGGMLASAGSFDGQLNHIQVHGTADVPDFSLDTANHPMPLHTKFSAVVDGTTGDTYLEQVDAKLADSQFSCNGSVVNQRGVGHTIDLDVDIPAGRIQDFLQLAMKTQPPLLTGVITTKEKLLIHPGKESVTKKMSMQGAFTLHQIHFSNPAVEDKVDMMSLRAQGDPQAAKPGAPDVHSQIVGGFAMDHGAFNFSKLDYTMPGAEVQLTGLYSMDGSKFDFHGTVRTQAKLSQMVAADWKSWLLKAVDPFFHKNGAGAEIPISVTGTSSSPKIGFDFHHHNDDKGAPPPPPK